MRQRDVDATTGIAVVNTLARHLALLATGWMLRGVLAPPRRPACLACHHKLADGTVAHDLTGGNRAAAAYHCRHGSCGAVMTIHVPTPGGAVTERLPAAEAAG